MGFTQANALAGGQVIFLETVVCGLTMTRLADALSSFLRPGLRLGIPKNLREGQAIGDDLTLNPASNPDPLPVDFSDEKEDFVRYPRRPPAVYHSGNESAGRYAVVTARIPF